MSRISTIGSGKQFFLSQYTDQFLCRKRGFRFPQLLSDDAKRAGVGRNCKSGKLFPDGVGMLIKDSETRKPSQTAQTEIDLSKPLSSNIFVCHVKRDGIRIGSDIFTQVNKIGKQIVTAPDRIVRCPKWSHWPLGQCNSIGMHDEGTVILKRRNCSSTNGSFMSETVPHDMIIFCDKKRFPEKGAPFGHSGMSRKRTTLFDQSRLSGINRMKVIRMRCDYGQFFHRRYPIEREGIIECVHQSVISTFPNRIQIEIYQFRLLFPDEERHCDPERICCRICQLFLQFRKLFRCAGTLLHPTLPFAVQRFAVLRCPREELFVKKNYSCNCGIVLQSSSRIWIVHGQEPCHSRFPVRS